MHSNSDGLKVGVAKSFCESSGGTDRRSEFEVAVGSPLQRHERPRGQRSSADIEQLALTIVEDFAISEICLIVNKLPVLL
jgi:hypothetical protein